MAEMAKFLFDTVFDPKGTPLETVSPSPQKNYWSTDERDTAKNEGFELGRQAGIAQTQATTEARTAAALESIAANVASLTSQLKNEREQLKNEAIVLANMIARSLTENLIAKEPLHEIEALFSEALNFLPDTPHIAVRMNETLLALAKEKLDAIAAERGFQGKLILLGQPDIDQGDCRIEWAQGGIVKDQKLVKQRIYEITNQYIEASIMPTEEELSGYNRTALLSNNITGESNGPDHSPDPINTAGQPEERKND